MKKKLPVQKKKFLRLNWQLYDQLLLNELQDYISPMQTNGNVLAILDCLILLCEQCPSLSIQKTRDCTRASNWNQGKPSPGD